MDCEISVNRELLNSLLEMGFDEERAKHALLNTGNESVESAATFLLNEVDAFEIQNQTQYVAIAESSEDEWEDVEEAYKMVFVINTDLNMSIGKTAAQVGHGAIGIYRELIKDVKHQESLTMWSQIGEKKIVLCGKNADQLIQLQEKARTLEIPSFLIRDAGYTEIAPNSVTVLALFGLEENVNKITGSLRLLK